MGGGEGGVEVGGWERGSGVEVLDAYLSEHGWEV